jgi:hypothetical protein
MEPKSDESKSRDIVTRCIVSEYLTEKNESAIIGYRKRSNARDAALRSLWDKYSIVGTITPFSIQFDSRGNLV